MSDFSDKLIKINTTLISVAFILIIFIGAFTHYTSLRPPQYIIVIISSLFIASWLICGSIYTVYFIIKLIKIRNIPLTFICTTSAYAVYLIADIYTYQIVYNSLGYNPEHAPHALRIISFISICYVSMWIVAQAIPILTSIAAVILAIINVLGRPFLFFLNQEKLDMSSIKLCYLATGSIVIGSALFMFSIHINRYLIFSDMIKIIAINTDYYSTKNAGYICKEAKKYDSFNYISNNMISVHKYDNVKNEHQLYMINCIVT